MNKQPPGGSMAIDVLESEPFDTAIINAVWDKANNEFGFFFFKRDRFGEIIAKHHYGERSQYGWEIEYIIPVSEGGTGAIENLRPVHWKHAAGMGERTIESRKG
jgi:hypothetical protein